MSWTFGLNSNVISLIMTFTNQLFEDGLVGKILQLLTQIDVDRELEKLAEKRAIGNER